mmetsp:Transcript_20452/g.29597  ORF Transcript_20452/g.29597 Transcript_20452/m.29597 type:complete len:330 (-) Transcript_20452:385-1374(-)
MASVMDSDERKAIKQHLKSGHLSVNLPLLPWPRDLITQVVYPHLSSHGPADTVIVTGVDPDADVGVAVDEVLVVRLHGVRHVAAVVVQLVGALLPLNVVRHVQGRLHLRLVEVLGHPGVLALVVGQHQPLLLAAAVNLPQLRPHGLLVVPLHVRCHPAFHHALKQLGPLATPHTSLRQLGVGGQAGGVVQGVGVQAAHELHHLPLHGHALLHVATVVVQQVGVRDVVQGQAALLVLGPQGPGHKLVAVEGAEHSQSVLLGVGVGVAHRETAKVDGLVAVLGLLRVVVDDDVGPGGEVVASIGLSSEEDLVVLQVGELLQELENDLQVVL